MLSLMSCYSQRLVVMTAVLHHIVAQVLSLGNAHLQCMTHGPFLQGLLAVAAAKSA